MTPGNDAPEKVHSSDSVSSDGEAPPALRITHEKVDTSRDLASLVEMFPEEPKHNLEYIYDLSNHNFSSACDHILDGISIDTLQSLAVGHHVFISLSESPRIILDDDDEAEDWVHSAVSFYKFNKFNPNAQVRISIRKQPGVDTGGIHTTSILLHCLS